MKKAVLVLLFFVVQFSQAQIVNIPDANFKGRLLSSSPTSTIAYGGGTRIKIDANSDGQIQVSEAMMVDSLKVSGGFIVDLTGILSFSNLKKLDCSFNAISGTLDLTSLSSLKKINCFTNHINALNVNGLNNLIELYCGSNQINVINFFGCSNLKLMHCEGNPLYTLDVTSLVNLQDLKCSYAQLTSLNVTGLSNLRQLVFDGNQISSISLNGLTSLSILDCSNNLLTNLNLTGLTNFSMLYCNNDQLTQLDFSGLLRFSGLECSNNMLTTLDFSGNPLFDYLVCQNNNLNYINLKNGINCMGNDTSPQWSGNANLDFVCVDESEVSIVQSIINDSGLVNVQANSYCSFIPGGNYNTIVGAVRFDGNSNGCDASDSGFANLMIGINDGITSGATFTNGFGNYSFYVQQPNLILTPSIENPSYFSISPLSATVNFPTNNSLTQISDFCITANGIHNDVEVIIVPIGRARPGLDNSYQIVYRNKGNQIMSGAINFTYNDATFDYVSASLSPNSQSTGALNWNYSNLLPFESRSFTVTLNLNSPVEIPAVNIGDQINFTADISPLAGDEMPMDNFFSLTQIVVGSYDPNEKICLEDDVVSTAKIGDYLHYTVNFENTGTALAQNIVVKDIIDTTKFDISTLQVMNASHTVVPKVTGNVVEFIFESINLATSQHGNVVFKIKTKNTLIAGNTVTNKADIFFDYNAPIATNIASTTFQNLSINEINLDKSVAVYPNPTNDVINIQSENTITSIQLLDIQGRLLVAKISDELNEVIDLTSKSAGIYFMKITTDKGIKVEKIVKK